MLEAQFGSATTGTGEVPWLMEQKPSAISSALWNPDSSTYTGCSVPRSETGPAVTVHVEPGQGKGKLTQLFVSGGHAAEGVPA